METGKTNSSDPKDHTFRIGKEFEQLIEHLREDIEKVVEPQAKALFEVSAEVLQGLRKAFDDYEKKSEKAWKDSAES